MLGANVINLKLPPPKPLAEIFDRRFVGGSNTRSHTDSRCGRNSIEVISLDRILKFIALTEILPEAINFIH